VGACVAHAELPQQIASVAPRALRTLDVRALKASEKTGRIPVTLPDGRMLRFVPLSVRERQGVTTLRGLIDGNRLLLTTDGRNAFGIIAAGSANYRITTVGRETYVIDIAALPPAPDVPLAPSLDDVRIDPALVKKVRQHMESRQKAGAAAIEVQDAAHSVVDIAIFLDPALLELFDPQVLRTMAQADIDYANEAFITNHIEVELNVVLVETNPGANLANPYNAFLNDTEAAARAASFGADLRHLLFDTRRGPTYCGMAELVGPVGVSGFQCPVGVISHEVGHNFGAHHDRPNAAGNVDLPISAYNYGVPCAGDATIMSYVGKLPLGYYSDPTLFNHGEACGVAFDQPNGAHNAHAIDVMRTEIEAFHAPQETYGTVSLSANTDSMDERDGSVDITVTRDGDLTRAASVELATIDETTDWQTDYVPLLNRLEFAPGETTRVVTMRAVDDANFEEDETFRVVLRYPLGLTVAGNPVTVTLRSEDPDFGRATLTTDAVSVPENSGTLAVTINRVGNLAAELTIQYATADGTGVAGDCYQAVSGSLTFAPGEASKVVQVPIIDNPQWDLIGFRTFTFALSGNNVGGFVGASTRMTVKVVSDDPMRGKAQLANEALGVGEAEGKVTLMVMRVDGTESELAVNYATADASAHAGKDYVAVSGTLVFAPGENSRTIDVIILNNTVVDVSRTFTVALTGPLLGTPTSARVTIANDDQASTEKKKGGGALEAESLLVLASLVLARRRWSKRVA
jgi:hypothetical protein